MPKVSGYPIKSAPALGDYLLGDDTAGGATSRFKLQDVIATIFNNIPSGETGELSLVQTYTPTFGTVSNATIASASGKYLNLLGLKLCWITIGISYSANGVHVTGMTFPPGFFTTGVDIVLPTVMGEGNYANQLISGDSVSGSLPNPTFSFYVTNVGASGGATLSFLAIGS